MVLDRLSGHGARPGGRRGQCAGPSRYDAFGNITSETNPSQGDRYGDQGMQFEATVSLYETVWRQYDPTTGKWTTMDPSGLGPDANPYRC